MKGLILFLACLFSLQLAVEASPSERETPAILSLYESASRMRSGAWTPEISSLSDLKEAWTFYLEWLNKADRLGGSGEQTPEWAHNLFKQFDQNQLGTRCAVVMKTAKLWRNRLVGFAGEDTVFNLEGALTQSPLRPVNSIELRALESSSDSFGSSGANRPLNPINHRSFMPSCGDFGSSGVFFVPGQGLSKGYP